MFTSDSSLYTACLDQLMLGEIELDPDFWESIETTKEEVIGELLPHQAPIISTL